MLAHAGGEASAEAGSTPPSPIYLSALHAVEELMRNKEYRRVGRQLTMSSMPMVFQLCMMGRKEMNVGMSQQPLSMAATLTGVILCL